MYVRVCVCDACLIITFVAFIPFGCSSCEDLMGLFEKRRYKSFVEFCNNYDTADKKAKQGIEPDTLMSDVFKKFSLDDNTQDFTGHAVCLYTDDKYKSEKFSPTLRRILLYS